MGTASYRLRFWNLLPRPERSDFTRSSAAVFFDQRFLPILIPVVPSADANMVELHTPPPPNSINETVVFGVVGLQTWTFLLGRREE